MKVDLYNISGKKTSKKADLNDKVFKVQPNQHSIYLTIKSELASKRQGTSSSKTRSEVRGGGAKPWKQKGTGRARVGSTRNPSRVHGGSAFGPRPHKYSVKVNRKVRMLAKKSALSIKVASNEYKILDKFILNTHKTKDLVETLKNLDLRNMKITVIINEKNDNLYFSSKNLEKINLVNAQSFSTYDIMNSNFILVDQSSVEYLNNLN